MRWILTALALLGFLIAIFSHSPGKVAFGVFLGLACGVGVALAFIDLHIRASSRPEFMTQGELDALKSMLRPPPSGSSERLPPPGVT